MTTLDEQLYQAHQDYNRALVYLHIMAGEIEWPTMTLEQFHLAHTRNSIRVTVDGVEQHTTPPVSRVQDLVYQLMMDVQNPSTQLEVLERARTAITLTRKKHNDN